MASYGKILVTAGRFMPTTAIVHALHRVGADVDVVDHWSIAPALHSRVAKGHVIDPPASDPVRYADQLAEICHERGIELIFGSFEDSFFLSRYRDRLPVPLFVPDFGTIEELHNKASFVKLCPELGLATPETRIAASQDELRDAISEFDEFFARPAFSRGGAHNMTNHGSHAGEQKVEDCHPTAENPWLVQQFVEGKDTCAMALARDGEIELACSYEPAIPSVGGFAVRFTSIEEPTATEILSKICKRFKYTGMIGIDFRRTPNGPVLIECNPRTTAGAFLADETVLGRAISEGLDDLHVVPAGRSKQYACYLFNRQVSGLSITEIAKDLVTAPDAMISQLDLMPFLHTFAYGRTITRKARETHSAVTEVSLKDVTWDGRMLPEP